MSILTVHKNRTATRFSLIYANGNSRRFASLDSVIELPLVPRERYGIKEKVSESLRFTQDGAKQASMFFPGRFSSERQPLSQINHFCEHCRNDSPYHFASSTLIILPPPSGSQAKCVVVRSNIACCPANGCRARCVLPSLHDCAFFRSS